MSELLDEELIDDEIPSLLPLVPLRDTVIFPFTMFPILVGRQATIDAVNASLEAGSYVFLSSQFDAEVEDPGEDDINAIGTVGKVLQVLNLPNNTMKVLVNGVDSVFMNSLKKVDGVMYADTEPYGAAPPNKKDAPTLNALVKKCREHFERYIFINEDLPEESTLALDNIEDPEHLLYYMASFLDQNALVKQNLLNEPELLQKYKELLTIFTTEIDVLTVSAEINEKVQEEIQQNQKKFFIQEQIRMLQEELDEDNFGDPDLARIKDQVDELNLPDEARAKALEELDRLRKMPQMSPEYSVSRNYLDWLVSLPWGNTTDDNLDIDDVETILNEDHFGLEKPKERILEHIAVLNLVEKMKGQILCFVGPPGTGKTSLANSIARAMDRKVVRIALGGVHDEAEIRGHRKTYIGSMPGRIIQSLKRAGSMNPVVILDEIDKVGSDHRGDPSSAILEVLDPEQNYAFNDHYLEIDFDLSQIMFITTANVASNIQPALLDRMELINLPGYLEHDKLEIAKQHLIPKQLKAHGLQSSKVKFKDEAIYEIIRKYTAESGVRNLEQQIAAVCRKVAKKVVERKRRDKKLTQFTVNEKRVRELLGVEKYRDRSPDKKSKIGSVQGLAWTSTGGTILQIDVAKMAGKNKFLLTGQLGDVMKESAQAALTYIRSHAMEYGIDPTFFDKNELHIHIPEGAIPKDGPSAGMAMALALISLITDRKIRHDVAMTGELTLRGEVLPIGGLNEKLLAAQRNKIKTVLIPEENMPNLEEIPDKVKEGLTIEPVKHIKDAEKFVFE